MSKVTHVMYRDSEGSIVTNVHVADIARADAVHRRMPLPFTPDYLVDNLDRSDLRVMSKKPYSIVAEQAGCDVGYLVAYERQAEECDGAKAMHIWLTGVVSSARRRGVLGVLLEALYKESRRRGRYWITVQSDLKQFPAMIAALQKASDGHSAPGPGEISTSRYKIYGGLFAELSEKRY